MRGTNLTNATTTERDGIATPDTGALVWNTSTSAVNAYDGAAWAAVGGTATGVMQKATVTLTGDTAIAAALSTPSVLFTTPATPGFIVTGASIRVAGTKFTGLPVGLNLVIKSSGATAVTFASLEDNAPLNSGTHTFVIFTPANTSSSGIIALGTDTVDFLMTASSGSFTGGDGTTVWTITTFYAIP